MAIFVPSLTKLLLTQFSAINVWVHFGVFDKNAKPSAVYHFQEDLGFIHGGNAISWCGCLLRQSPASPWRLCLFGDSRSVPK
ncbi:hypothetical protein EK904_001885 [Melospiza melodia maxima]|nr:hypothetical protein EK904_001885 [Melospiza melodia maxima]